MSAWSLWISGVSVYEGNAINGVASGSVRLYNSDFSFHRSANLKCSLMWYWKYHCGGSWKEAAPSFLSCFPPSSNRGQGMCAIRSWLKSTWRTLLFSGSVLEQQTCGLSVLLWGSVPGVSVCGSELRAALERPAQESGSPPGFAFPSVKQRSENRALCVVEGRGVPISFRPLKAGAVSMRDKSFRR